jgi:hypothetical protein
MDVIILVVVHMEVVVLIAGLLCMQVLGGWGDRRRIRKHFQQVGGRVLAIAPRCVWRSREDWLSRVYEVRSCDIHGREQCALYRTGFWLGTWRYSPLDCLQKHPVEGRLRD